MNNLLIYHKSTGVLRIEASKTIGRWWAYLECCPDLGRYYRYSLLKFTCEYRNIMAPKLGSHITLVRYEIPTTVPMSFKNEIVQFTYSHKIFSNEKHFWLNVNCDFGNDFREKMGLTSEPLIPFHLTFGVMPGENLFLV